jgi:septum formation protein
MNFQQLKSFKIVLASQSPRRRQLLEQTGIEFEVCSIDVDESYPPHLHPGETALYLSRKKAKVFNHQKIRENEIMITADTIVAIRNKIIPKPVSHEEAIQFLTLLSGKMHSVYTGVTLKSRHKLHSFLSESKVWFRHLSEEEIVYYVTNFKPFDKAGAYGIQEWIGYIGIERIEGSFFNIMGLPTSMLYTELIRFTEE